MQLYTHLSANSILLSDFPFARELSMEAYLIENPSVLALDDDELSSVSILSDELALRMGRPSRQTDGRLDLLARFGSTTLAMIELKLGELNRTHLDQLEDYLASRDKVAGDFPEVAVPGTKWIGILVGSAIDSVLREEINNGKLIAGDIPIAALVVRRFRGSDGQVFVITDTFFQNKSRKFDNSQYEFNGAIYGKGRLVLAVLQEAVRRNPALTRKGLEDLFPASLQGGKGIIATVDDATARAKESGYRRHFLKPEETLQLQDCRVAVSTQWGKDNILPFIKHAVSHGYDIKSLMSAKI